MKLTTFEGPTKQHHSVVGWNQKALTSEATSGDLIRSSSEAAVLLGVVVDDTSSFTNALVGGVGARGHHPPQQIELTLTRNSTYIISRYSRRAGRRTQCLTKGIYS